MAINCNTQIDPFDSQHVEAICRVLADTDLGLTGSEIGHLLQDCKIHDPDPTLTKWKRLFNAFAEFQNKHNVGNHIVVFIKKAMSPAIYTENPTTFQLRRDQLNRILAFRGMEVGNDGQIHNVQVAANLDDAMARASRLRTILTQRSVHEDVLRYCTAEIIQENYFHTVFEAMKSITSKIRKLSGFSSDGTRLVDAAFALGKDINPVLAINPLRTETEQGEQKGFSSLLKGLYGTIRNPLSHEAKIEWDMNEQDAIDILTMISLIHRKLDKVRRQR